MMSPERAQALGRTLRRVVSGARHPFVPMVRTAGVLALFGAYAATAWAEPKVSHLRVGSSDTAAESTKVFPLGTEQIFILFDYDGLSNQQIGVKIVSPSGLQLFSSAERLSGKGSRSIVLAGTEIYRNLADLMVTSLVQIQGNAGLVTTQLAGQKEFLNQVMANVLTAKSVAAMLTKLPLGDSLRDERATLERVLADIEKKTDEARQLPPDRVNDMNAAATEIKRLAEGVVAPAKTIQDGAKAATKVPLPESGVDARTTYVAQVEINSDPADSVEFQVSNDKPLPPTAEPTRPPRTESPSGAQPTSAAGARPSATSVQAQSGARATVVTSGPQAASTTVASLGAAATAVAVPTLGGGAGAPNAGQDTTQGQTAAYPGATQAVNPAANPAVATWTPEAGAASSGVAGSAAAEPTAASGATAPPGGQSPNLAVLGLGVLALGGLFLWLRRRSL